MPQLIQSILDQVQPTAILDIGITALLIYWLFSLIRGTSAVRLVIGVTVLFAVYFAARILSLRLLTQILETGAVVGLFALVVVFQPELRRALERIGRVGSFNWLLSPTDQRSVDRVAEEVNLVDRPPAAVAGDGEQPLARADVNAIAHGSPPERAWKTKISFTPSTESDSPSRSAIMSLPTKTTTCLRRAPWSSRT